VLPELQRVQQLAETAWADGGDSYVVVLQTTSQVLTARQREQELQADLRRAAAELSRSAGRRIDALEIQETDLPVLPSASTPAAEGQKP
jgi:cobalt-zinc-cadmium efflux system outer membrane protein